MSDTLAVSMYDNPLSIQAKVMDEFQARIGLSDGDFLVDANNVFSFTVEAFSSVAGSIVANMNREFDSLYAKRAVTANALYKHMSDYDYVGLFSSPADCSFKLIMDKNYLRVNSIPVEGTDYRKLVIPAYSTFRAAQYYFGIYYPINIMYNPAADAFNVIWDTTYNNPLQKLTTNTIEFSSVVSGGAELFGITVPTQQFIRTVIDEDLIDGNGFIRTYDYTDKFYAVRVWYTDPLSTADNYIWKEMRQTLSDTIYDPTVPTVKLVVDLDTNRFRLAIPQVYFTNGLMGTKLKVELYTSLGAINVDFGKVSQEELDANFSNIESTVEPTYVYPLLKMPTCYVLPMNNRVVGGTNGYSVEELHTKVINNSFYSKALVTKNELNSYFSSRGFTITNYQDGITDRIYIASRALVDGYDSSIASGIIKTRFDNNTLNTFSASENSNIIKSGNNEYVVLPTTMYKYDTSEDAAIPMSQSSKERNFGQLSNEAVAEELNNEIYTLTPYHLLLNTDTKAPTATLFNLSSPSIDNILFGGDNENISGQISLYTASISHLNDGTAGYSVRVIASISNDLITAMRENGITEGISTVGGEVTIAAVLYYLDENANWVATMGVPSNVNFGDEENYRTLFTFMLPSNYNLSDRSTIGIKARTAYDSEEYRNLNLNTPCKLFFFAYRGLMENPAISKNVIPPFNIGLLEQYIPTTWQSFDLNFGKIINRLHSGVNIAYTPNIYATYTTTVFATYDRDIYATKWVNVDGVMTPVPEEDYGKLSVAHRRGEVITPPQMTVSTENNLVLASAEEGSNKTATRLYRLTSPTAYPATDNEWIGFSKNADGFVVSNIANQLVVYDALKFILSLFADSDEPTSTSILSVVYETVQDMVNPSNDIDQAVFAWVNDVTTTEYHDDSVPECDLGYITTETTNRGALYRRDIVTRKWIKVAETVLFSELRAYSTNSVYAKCGTMYVIKDQFSNVSYFELLSFVRDQRTNEYKFTIVRESEIDPDTTEVNLINNSVMTIQDADTVLISGNGVPVTCARSGVRYTASSAIKFSIQDPNVMLNGNPVYHVGDTFEFIQLATQDNEQGRIVINKLDAIVNDTQQYTEVLVANTTSSVDFQGYPIPRRYVFTVAEVDGKLTWENVTANDLSSTSALNVNYVDRWPWDCHNWIGTTTDGYKNLPVSSTSDPVFSKTLFNSSKALRTGNYLIYNIPSVVGTMPAGTYYWINNITNNDTQVPKIVSLVDESSTWFGGLYYHANEAGVDAGNDVLLVKANSLTDMLTWYKSSIFPIGYYDATVDVKLLPDSWEKLYTGEEFARETTVPLVFKHNAGETMIDENGKPVLDDTVVQRDTIFYVDMVHVDAKLAWSNRPLHQNYLQSIRTQLDGYFTTLDTAKQEMLERTELYFSPVRSLGYGQFKRDEGTIVTLPLDITIKLKLYVTSYVLKDSNVQEQLRKGILNIIEKHLKTNVLSCTAISDDIRTSLGDNVIYVDVLGIDGDSTLQTLMGVDSDIRPHLKQVLTVLADGTLSVDRGLELEYVAVN